MSQRYLASLGTLAAATAPGVVMGLLLQFSAAGQAPPVAAKAKASAKTWTQPRTPDGQPDLQGFWTNGTVTPLERPGELAGKEVLDEEEAVEYQQKVLAQADATPPGLQAGRSIDAIWFERGKIVEGRRTSLIVDPPDGRVPPLTPEAQKRAASRAQETRLHPADGPESRSLGERCLIQANTGPPMLPTGYNNNYQVVQGPGYVMILVEMMRQTRIIPLDGRPHLARNIRQWKGDSRGHWEGNTLVVDTTNFNDQTAFRGADENLHLVERFTRTAADTIRYEFTVDDPTAFTKPWSAQLPMHTGVGPIYEYACHEGNYDLMNILKGAREDDKRAAEEATKQGSK
jgi:hypothetical protein